MFRITIKVDGMMCGMCESHVNDAVRRAFPIKKVSSSHARGETVILTEREIDADALKRVIDDTGYTAGAICQEPFEHRKGLLGFLRR